MDTTEKLDAQKLEEIVNSLLIEIFPWLWYKVPRLSYSLQPEDISQNLLGKREPKRLTQTHFAILCHLGLEKDKTVLQSELYNKLGWVSFTLYLAIKSPLDSLNIIKEKNND